MLDKQLVFEGIIIGVSSGIVLGLFSWIGHSVRRYFSRREQIRYLRDLLVRFRDLIVEANEIHHRPSGRTFQRDVVQKAYYDDLRSQLKSTLNNRCSRLSYDEVREVQSVFFTHIPAEVILNEKGYNSIFAAVESMTWLKMPFKAL